MTDDTQPALAFSSSAFTAKPNYSTGGKNTAIYTLLPGTGALPQTSSYLNDIVLYTAKIRENESEDIKCILYSSSFWFCLQIII